MMFKILLISIYLIIKTSLSFAEIVNDIIVTGNERVSKETIKVMMFHLVI